MDAIVFELNLTNVLYLLDALVQLLEPFVSKSETGELETLSILCVVELADVVFAHSYSHHQFFA